APRVSTSDALPLGSSARAAVLRDAVSTRLGDDDLLAGADVARARVARHDVQVAVLPGALRTSAEPAAAADGGSRRIEYRRLRGDRAPVEPSGRGARVSRARPHRRLRLRDRP